MDDIAECTLRPTSCGFDVVNGVPVQLQHVLGVRLLLLEAAHGKGELGDLDKSVMVMVMMILKMMVMIMMIRMVMVMGTTHYAYRVWFASERTPSGYIQYPGMYHDCCAGCSWWW